MTKQEQIKEMAHIMCEYYNKGFCANGDITEICEDMPYCCYKNDAEALYDAGYGNVSEYKAEIERLKEKCEELRNEKWDAQDDLDCYCDEMPTRINQAIKEFAGKIKNYINNNVEDEYGDMSDSVNYITIDIDEFETFIDNLLEEQNGKDKD